MTEATLRMGFDCRSPHWSDWDIGSRRSETKAAMDRFRRDHPDYHAPWGYCPP